MQGDLVQIYLGGFAVNSHRGVFLAFFEIQPDWLCEAGMEQAT